MRLALQCNGTHDAQCHVSYKKQYQNVNVGHAFEIQYNVISMSRLNTLAQVYPSTEKKEKQIDSPGSLRVKSSKSPSFFMTSPEIPRQLSERWRVSRVDVT